MKRYLGFILNAGRGERWLAALAFSSVLPLLGMAAERGSVVEERIESDVLRENRIGLDVTRQVKVYLPPGYERSERRYPVVYYLHNTFWSPDQMFADGNLVRLLERAFEAGVTKEFIFVAANYTTPTTGSLYENSPVTGRWLDFTVRELVPFIDGNFRTLPRRESRAVVGDFFGGRGALKLAMVHAEMFSVAYALHPVATGNGEASWARLDVNWAEILRAKSVDEVRSGGRTWIFLAISQAFLSNVDRPPFYCDFPFELQDGEARLHVENTLRAKRAFLLEETLSESAANLRTMRGLALDWGRFDPTQAHVKSNRLFSQLLEDLGVEHEAEEYTGGPWDKTWTEDGRFAARVLPFLGRRLGFGE